MIREMTKADFDSFWPAFEAIIKAQETYNYSPSMSFTEAYHHWCEESLKAFVMERDQQIVGTYYVKANAKGPGDHICTCGYMVANQAQGQGIGRKLCAHSQDIARGLNFKAMVFNSVVATNEIAIHLWQDIGYRIVGTIPKSYRHAQCGLVDSYIMFKSL